MARRDSGPQRSESIEDYLRRTRRLAVVALLTLAGGVVVVVVSDLLARSFWVENPVLAGLLSSAIVVVLTVALVNEAIERRSRARWRVSRST